MHDAVSAARQYGRNLFEHEAMALLAEYGIPAPRHRFVKSPEEAAEATDQIGYPVVLKIVSKDILHKSEAGGVKTGIGSGEELKEKYSEISRNVREGFPDAEIEGMLVVGQAEKGLECIVGMTRDEQFGPALLFGLGGVFVEALEDVSFSLLPVSASDARAMIESTKGYKLLRGYRGEAPRDVEAIVDLIVKTGKLAEENPGIQEIDINPFFVYEHGVMPVDVRIIVGMEAG